MDEQSMEMESDRQQLISLKKELSYGKKELFSSLPFKRYNKKLKDKPLMSEE